MRGKIKLISAKEANEKAKANFLDKEEKNKQKELAALMEWIQEAIDIGDSMIIVDRDAFKYAENEKIIKDLGYVIKDIGDYERRIMWNEA